MNGSMNERNCATRIRYSSSTESVRPSAKLLNDERMPSTIPRTVTSTPAGSLVCAISVVDLIGDRAEAFVQRAHINIEHAADLVVIHFGGRFEARDVADHVEARRALQSGAVQRNGAQIEQALNLLLGILNVQEIVVVVLRIDPDIRRDHLIRSERGDDVLDDFLFAQSQFAGARAIDVELQRGIVEILRNVDIGDAVDLPDLTGKVERGLVAGLQIRAAHLHVDGRGSPRFSTASTRLPEEKYAASSGISCCMRGLHRAMYS